MNKKYGCDVVEYEELIKFFSQKFIDDLKKFGVTEILRLNKRTKGLTSSGRKLQCHLNVCNLVSTFGGRHKHGFLVEQDFSDTTGQLTYHSAWLTPEKNLVCVTPRESNSSRFKSNDIFFFLLKGDHELDVHYDSVYYASGMFLPFHRDPSIDELAGHMISHYSQANFSNSKREVRNLLRGIANDDFSSYFSKKSILTKKSFGEIQETPYAKKMRDIFQVLPKNKKHARKKKKVIDEMSFIFSTA